MCTGMNVWQTLGNVLEAVRASGSRLLQSVLHDPTIHGLWITFLNTSNADILAKRVPANAMPFFVHTDPNPQAHRP